MQSTKTLKDLKGFTNDNTIVAQYVVSYGINNTSRYKHIDDLYLIDGTTLKAPLGPIDTSVYPFDAYTVYTVSDQDLYRPDIIATKVYGKASLYWAICYANNIVDPLTEITLGKTLLIPSLDTLKRFPNPLS